MLLIFELRKPVKLKTHPSHSSSGPDSRGLSVILLTHFFQYEITVLEEKLQQMKPNMAAIAEYRKKVMYGKRLLLIFAMSRAWGVNLQT